MIKAEWVFRLILKGPWLGYRVFQNDRPLAYVNFIYERHVHGETNVICDSNQYVFTRIELIMCKASCKYQIKMVDVHQFMTMLHNKKCA